MKKHFMVMLVCGLSAVLLFSSHAISEQRSIRLKEKSPENRLALVIYFAESGGSEPSTAPVSAGKKIINSMSMEFVYIPPGTFIMGSPENEPGRDSNEKQHQITLTKGFYMQTTEVTQGQWKAVMGNNPSASKDCGDNCPVEKVSWDDVQKFIKKLNLDSARLPAGERSRTYRLPTEAEWEYAARAGSKTAFANGNITGIECGKDPNLDAMGWYCWNSDRKTHPAAEKRANAWGLYDMHGNVYEWCQDIYGTDIYKSGQTDPIYTGRGSHHVVRGGGCFDYVQHCRSGYRGYDLPDNRSYGLGCRLVLP